MKELTTALRRLEALLQEELAAQSRTFELLAEQQTALLGKDPELVRACGEALEQDSRRGVERARRRDELIGKLAAHWRVHPSVLTLSSIVERAGVEGERIAKLRGELRTRAAQTVRSARRVAALAQLHQRFFSDVLSAIFAHIGGENAEVGGALVDAEA